MLWQARKFPALPAIRIHEDQLHGWSTWYLRVTTRKFPVLSAYICFPKYISYFRLNFADWMHFHHSTCQILLTDMHREDQDVFSFVFIEVNYTSNTTCYIILNLGHFSNISRAKWDRYSSFYMERLEAENQTDSSIIDANTDSCLTTQTCTCLCRIFIIHFHEWNMHPCQYSPVSKG